MKYLYIILTILFASCSKNDSTQQNLVNMNISVAVDISFINNQNEDLLNCNTLGCYNYENFELSYLVDGNIVSVYDYDPQLNNGMMLIKETNPYVLRCFTYSNENDGIVSDTNGIVTGISFAYLKLNDEEIDTLKTEWVFIKNKSFINTKVWYNDDLYPLDGKPINVIK